MRQCNKVAAQGSPTHRSTEIDNTGPKNGALAAFELELIRERVTAGMERARKEGKAIGRPKIADDPVKSRRLQDAVASVQAGTLSYRKAAAEYHVSISSIQRAMQEVPTSVATHSLLTSG